MKFFDKCLIVGGYICAALYFIFFIAALFGVRFEGVAVAFAFLYSSLWFIYAVRDVKKVANKKKDF